MRSMADTATFTLNNRHAHNLNGGVIKEVVKPQQARIAEEAGAIARRLVEAGLAAGAQILPIDSIYRWQADIVEDSEWLMLVKTRQERFRAIESVVNEMHSYEVPPILMIEMDDASEPYLAWIDGNVM